ncbi:MAG: HDIG domain-containing protein [Peptococcaceae bacterium]|nr:HDIG domain-containing protein [Peptococcaceae bacterium]
MLTREQAFTELAKYVKNKNLIKHMVSVEAVMTGLADHFGEDREKWGLTGLLHDIDYDETKDDPQLHSLKGAEILSELGFPEEVVHAVKVHNHAHGIPRTSLLDKALYAADPVSGLVVAGALVRPDKKLASVDQEYLVKKFGEKAFARGADREQIRTCTEIGLEVEEFLEISLRSMQKVAEDLEL